jgi:hypothetical protein
VSVREHDCSRRGEFLVETVAAKVEEFEFEAYTRHSDNNMLLAVTYVPLTEQEQAEADSVLKVS